MEKINWGEIESASDDFKRVCPGGYVCEIIKVEEFPQKQYLKIWADIIDGEFKNIGQDTMDRTGKDWGYLSFIRSYKPAARPFFKGFLTSLENSNPKFKVAAFDGDETKLIGLKVGLIMGEEEYINRDNELKTSCKVQKITSVQKIKDGDFEIPKLKALPEEKKVVAMGTVENDTYGSIPF